MKNQVHPIGTGRRPGRRRRHEQRRVRISPRRDSRTEASGRHDDRAPPAVHRGRLVAAGAVTVTLARAGYEVPARPRRFQPRRGRGHHLRPDMAVPRCAPAGQSPRLRAGPRTQGHGRVADDLRDGRRRVRTGYTVSRSERTTIWSSRSPYRRTFTRVRAVLRRAPWSRIPGLPGVRPPRRRDQPHRPAGGSVDLRPGRDEARASSPCSPGSRGASSSKTQLLSLVWGFDGYQGNLVEVHVSSFCSGEFEVHRGPAHPHRAG